MPMGSRALQSGKLRGKEAFSIKSRNIREVFDFLLFCVRVVTFSMLTQLHMLLSVIAAKLCIVYCPSMKSL